MCHVCVCGGVAWVGCTRTHAATITSILTTASCSALKQFRCSGSRARSLVWDSSGTVLWTATAEGGIQGWAAPMWRPVGRELALEGGTELLAMLEVPRRAGANHDAAILLLLSSSGAATLVQADGAGTLRQLSQAESAACVPPERLPGVSTVTASGPGGFGVLYAAQGTEIATVLLDSPDDAGAVQTVCLGFIAPAVMCLRRDEKVLYLGLQDGSILSMHVNDKVRRVPDHREVLAHEDAKGQQIVLDAKRTTSRNPCSPNK